MSADDTIAAEQDRYTEPVDPYWSERAAPPAKPAPALTPDAATTAIAAKLDDPDFAKRYYGEYEKGHNDAVGEMAGLYSLAHPGDGPALIERPAVEPTTRRPDAQPAAAGDVQQGEAPEEKTPELQAQQRAEELEHLLGDNAGERCDTARAWLGPEMTAAVNATEFGNEPQAIAEMVELAERDSEGLVRATVQELLGKQIYHSGATLERKRLEADQKFVDAYLDGDHVGHAEAMAKMEALRLLEHPPAWARAALENLHANR